MVGIGRGLWRAGENPDGDHAHSEVDETARKRSDSLESFVRTLRAASQRRADEPPERVAAEADRNESEQDFAEGLVGNGMKGTLLVRELAAVADSDVEREDADDAVDDPARHEASPPEQLEGPRVDETISGRAGLRDRGPGINHVRARHLGLLL